MSTPFMTLLNGEKKKSCSYSELSNSSLIGMSLCYVSHNGKKKNDNYNWLKNKNLEKLFLFSFLPWHIKIHLDNRHRTITKVQTNKLPSVIRYFFLSPWIV